MPRTTILQVQGILGSNYGPLEDGTLPDLQQFIDSATVIVDRVATCASNRNKTLTDGELELIERWLSAHLYAQMDMLYQSRSTGGASGSFQGQTGMSLDSTRYGQTAVNIDYSGCLSAIGKRQATQFMWLGKPASQQIPIDQRD
jgi:hypothetical protein